MKVVQKLDSCDFMCDELQGQRLNYRLFFLMAWYFSRNKPVAIWGQADPFTKITVRFGGIHAIDGGYG